MDEVEEILARQVTHLPFDAAQRARACAFAREVRELALMNDAAPDAVAAAVAYAIVAHDEVPLTQAEVAATFRVPVSALRTRYYQLRSLLDSPSRVSPVSRMRRLSSTVVSSTNVPSTIVSGARIPEARVPLRASRSSRSARKSKK